MTLRQVLNVAYMAQAEGKLGEGELERWDATLRAKPGHTPSFISPQLAQLMPIAAPKEPSGPRR